MPAGTITLTNNSTAVSGSGTAFPTELKANDFIVAVVGGTTYTLGVKSVESATALTLTTAYGGPTTGALAWTPIPNGTLVGITAQIATDTARAIRGLNYDKQNWQQVYSASGNITVTLPDGSTWAGPSWKYLSDNMATKSGGAVPVNQGGTGSVTESGARTKLGLGTAAVKDIGPKTGDVMTIGTSGFGAGGHAYSYVSNAESLNDYWDELYLIGGAVTCRINGPIGVGEFSLRYAPSFYMRSADVMSLLTIHYSTGNCFTVSGVAGVQYVTNLLWGTANTTVDNNGFIKQASPIVKLFAKGDFEANNESEGVTVTRQGVGKYLIEGCTGLNADASWGGIDGGFEIPTNRNKQPRIWLDYEVNAEGSVLVKTYHRTHPDAPEFARNLIGIKNEDGTFTETVKNGELIDIPADSFVSVRVEMPDDSIWNKKLAEADKTIEEAHRAAAKKDQEESEQPHI